MDAIVKRAMAKWPGVPNCFGWLGLGARGTWYLRDAACQARGAFTSGVAGSKGAPLRQAPLLAFLGRNYEADARGCWYFQNGPQRVFVELEIAPWVWRLQPDGSVRAHTGAAARVARAWTDEVGRLYLSADLGFGLVHTQDVGQAAEMIERGEWTPECVPAGDLPARFGYVPSPARMAAG